MPAPPFTLGSAAEGGLVFIGPKHRALPPALGASQVGQDSGSKQGDKHRAQWWLGVMDQLTGYTVFLVKWSVYSKIKIIQILVC